MSNLTIKEMCEKTGLVHATIYRRLRTKGIKPVGSKKVMKVVDGVNCYWDTHVYDEQQAREVLKW